MENKDDVLRELLRPLIEELVGNALNAYLSVHGLDEAVETALKKRDAVTQQHRLEIYKQQEELMKHKEEMWRTFHIKDERFLEYMRKKLTKA